MKQAPNYSMLDNFIREKLLSPDKDARMGDWSEMEVLIGAEQKPVSISINKKQVFLIAGTLAAGLCLFGIFKTVQYYKSLPEENAPAADSTLNTFNTIDTTLPVLKDSIVLVKDTAETDSLAITEKKTDSILAASDALIKKVNENLPPVTEKIIAKEKKQKNKQVKTAPIDSASHLDPIEIIPPPLDTAGKSNPVEIKPATVDSAKISSPSKKSKKGKSKKNSPDSTKAAAFPEILPAKPDSAK